MAETEIEVSVEFLRGLVFGSEMIEIHGIRLEGNGVVILEVHGVGVPEGIGARARVRTERTQRLWLEPASTSRGGAEKLGRGNIPGSA